MKSNNIVLHLSIYILVLLTLSGCVEKMTSNPLTNGVSRLKNGPAVNKSVSPFDKTVTVSARPADLLNAEGYRYDDIQIGARWESETPDLVYLDVTVPVGSGEKYTNFNSISFKADGKVFKFDYDYSDRAKTNHKDKVFSFTGGGKIETRMGISKEIFEKIVVAEVSAIRVELTFSNASELRDAYLRNGESQSVAHKNLEELLSQADS
jgi:hypothetical protein